MKPSFLARGTGVGCALRPDPHPPFGHLLPEGEGKIRVFREGEEKTRAASGRESLSLRERVPAEPAPDLIRGG
jgi:hypothetical protein